MAYSYYNHPFSPPCIQSHYSTTTSISTPPFINPFLGYYYPTSYPQFYHQQQPIVSAPSQQLPSSPDFFSQPETLHQLEILKHYITETHEISNRSREELKEQIQNLSDTFKKTQEEWKQKYVGLKTTEKPLEKEEKIATPVTLLAPTTTPTASPTSIPAITQVTTPAKPPDLQPKPSKPSSPQSNPLSMFQSTIECIKVCCISHTQSCCTRRAYIEVCCRWSRGGLGYEVVNE
ncbi:uncharacterized protein LOC131630170 isoform X1 [Vicia villosa]|uniref:uncharacterized protein LOC131630170 isoform X1 n=1 Tax=Vicia villosa TaxID=3911 RepID=UPI00273C2B8A|nr:uncharacterized protein LOC131630170 isoform X1 [Vicia villosa]